MSATKTAANFLPAHAWARKLGVDWGHLPASSWEEVDLDLNDGIPASPSFERVINSELWDSSQLRSWVKITVEVNPAGLQTVSASVEEWLWTGPPGSLDGLPLPDTRDMGWKAEETAPDMWRQSLKLPAGQPVAVLHHLMKMVEWLGVDSPLVMVDTSGNAAAREAQARADERAERFRREEEERLAHNQRHAEFLKTPEGRAWQAQVDEEWRLRMEAERAAVPRCGCSGPEHHPKCPESPWRLEDLRVQSMEQELRELKALLRGKGTT